MEYEKMFEEIKDNSGETFKPTLGVHNIEILEEPVPTEYTDGEKVTPQILLKVKINDETKNWYVSYGSTIKSLYGQLIALGKHKGKLMGEKITLSVTSSNNKNGETVNAYQVIEAVKILPLVMKPKVEDVK